LPNSGGLVLKIKVSSQESPDDVFLVCDSSGKCLEQIALKDGKKTGAGEYELKFTKVPKDTKDLLIKIEDKEKRIVDLIRTRLALKSKKQFDFE